jgi:hypothetical protein
VRERPGPDEHGTDQVVGALLGDDGNIGDPLGCVRSAGVGSDAAASIAAPEAAALGDIDALAVVRLSPNGAIPATSALIAATVATTATTNRAATVRRAGRSPLPGVD